MNIALIGYRGTGKSTVGRLLADALNYAFIDADEALVTHDGRTIQQIFADDGEDFFRELESRILSDLVARKDTVVALGGGVVLREQNRALLTRCTTCWLRASAATLHQRLHADPKTESQRPNLTPEGGLAEIERLLQQRLPLYQQCADFTFDTDTQSPAGIVAEILKLPLLGAD